MRHSFDPWVTKIPGGGNGNPLQYSCLENPRDKGAWCRLLSMGSQRLGHDWETSLTYLLTYSLFLEITFSRVRFRILLSPVLRPYFWSEEWKGHICVVISSLKNADILFWIKNESKTNKIIVCFSRKYLRQSFRLALFVTYKIYDCLFIYVFSRTFNSK